MDMADLQSQTFHGTFLQSTDTARGQYRVHHFKLENFRKLMSIGHFLLKIDDEPHLFGKFVVQKLEQLDQILANRHVFPCLLQNTSDIFVDFLLVVGLLRRRQGKQWKIDGYNVPYLHKSLLRCHVEASFFLNSIIFELGRQFLHDFCLSSGIHPCIRIHSLEFCDSLFLFRLDTDGVVDPIAKVDESADDQQFQGCFRDDMLKKILLIGPVKHQNHGFFEVEFMIEVFIKLIQFVNQMLTIKQFRVSVQTSISFQTSNIVEQHL